MNGHVDDTAQRLMGLIFKAHPWHGVSIGEKAPEVVTAYIEIVPTDTVKYEVDKDSGFLKVDRPQRFSNYCPVYYGSRASNLLRRQVAAIFWRNGQNAETSSGTEIPSISVFSPKRPFRTATSF